ncbi:MAG: substrate-binding domain-containing protein [Proteobacteria bacterium]|nr:substrate-binding domain-containing protein [Pseudomonadota bacterium]
MRRRALLGLLAAASAAASAHAAQRPYRIAFANLTDAPAPGLEGLGFSGADVRASFEAAARRLPVEVIYFDNAGDPARAVANADAAIAARADLLVEYNADPDANAEIARRMKAAGIPVLALVHPVPGAPLYGPDDLEAGRIAGRALGAFARENWPNEKVRGVLIGDLADPSDAVNARVRGITEGAGESLPGLEFAPLDTGGQPVRADAMLTKFMRAEPGAKLLVATLDDVAAIYARNAVELNRRQSDVVIASQGLDPHIHGGMNEKKEIDANNRGSVVIGSVAYFMDRYGYDVLPIALRMLAGETVPPVTRTQHILVGASNVFKIYPPFDIN